MANGYPESFLDSCIQKFVNKVVSGEQGTLAEYGPEKKQVCLSLPYCGAKSDKLKRQLRRMFSVVFPWIDLVLVFKPCLKLNCLSKLKSQIPKLSRSRVVYRIKCQDCEEFYVGMTCRRLEQRVTEHTKDSNSALFKHASSTGHNINFQDPDILDMDPLKLRLLVKETLSIQETRAFNSLNRNIGSFDLKLW